MALITNSNATLAAGASHSTAFAPSAAGFFMLTVFSGEVVLETRRAGGGTGWAPAFQDSRNTSGQPAPALKGKGVYTVYTAAGMEFQCTAGSAGAVVEANQ